MALPQTHLTTGAAVGACIMAVVGAPLNWFSLTFIALAAWRTEWPDASMVWPTIKAMWRAYQATDPAWYKVRDWTEYVRFHGADFDSKIADPFIRLHRWIDKPFHAEGSGGWWKRLWWLDISILLISLIVLYVALVIMAFN